MNDNPFNLSENEVIQDWLFSQPELFGVQNNTDSNRFLEGRDRIIKGVLINLPFLVSKQEAFRIKNNLPKEAHARVVKVSRTYVNKFVVCEVL